MPKTLSLLLGAGMIATAAMPIAPASACPSWLCPPERFGGHGDHRAKLRDHRFPHGLHRDPSKRWSQGDLRDHRKKRMPGELRDHRSKPTVPARNYPPPPPLR
jgi:hypothetical protein